MKKHSEKDRDERERKKIEKEDKKRREKTERKNSKSGKHGATQEELNQLEQAKSRLFPHGDVTRGKATNGSVSVTPSDSVDSLGSSSAEGSPASSQYTSRAELEISRTVRVPPPTKPKPQRGILKGRSNYGPQIPNHGVRGNLDDTVTLEINTRDNELIAEELRLSELKMLEERQAELRESQGDRAHSVKSIIQGFEPDDSLTDLVTPLGAPPTAAPPPPPPAKDGYNSDDYESDEPEVVVEEPPTPTEKTYDNVDLQLPNLAPPRSLQPRDISLKRLPTGDFGFSLRKGTVLERSLDDNNERKRVVIFAEPGPKNSHTGLLPGDRLIEVNGNNVENCTREEIIEHIRKSSGEVILKVQPIPELSELSVRSGLEGEEVGLGEQNVKMGTLKRSGSMRYKNKQVRYKNKQVRYKNKQVRYKNKQVRYKNKQVRYKNKQVRYKNKQVRYKNKQVRYKNKQVRYKNKQVRYNNKQVRCKNKQVRYKNKQVRYKNKQYKNKQVRYKNKQYKNKQVRYKNKQVRYKNKQYKNKQVNIKNEQVKLFHWNILINTK